MTPRECARLQSMDSLKALPTSPTQAFQALGNAVNSRVVEMVARALLSSSGTAPPAAGQVRLKSLRELAAA